jgi:hypothetical protein
MTKQLVPGLTGILILLIKLLGWCINLAHFRLLNGIATHHIASRISDVHTNWFTVSIDFNIVRNMM